MGNKTIYLENERLITNKGVITKWSYIRDAGFKKYGRTNRRIITAKCNCGNQRDVQLCNIINGSSVGCGLKECKIPYNKGIRSVETTYNSMYYAYKKGAVDRGFTFELTMDEFKGFLHKNCYYCGSEPSNTYQIKNSKTGEVRAGIPVTYNGIDRIDNTLGYTNSNSITCCEICNRMKRNYNYDKFIEHIIKIYKNICD
jgi:hypothetical protein